jgi:hypothetical protein
MTPPPQETLLDPRAERPTAVTVIGGVWLAAGLLRFLSSLTALLLWRAGGLKEMFGSPNPLSGLPASRILNVVFRYFGVGVSVQAAAGLVVAFCAYGLLRLRPWARPVIEALCWLGLTWIVCFTAVWAIFWTRLSDTAAAAANNPLLGRLALGAALVVGGALAVAFAAMIRALRRPFVRAAFRPT